MGTLTLGTCPRFSPALPPGFSLTLRTFWRSLFLAGVGRMLGDLDRVLGDELLEMLDGGGEAEGFFHHVSPFQYEGLL